MLTGLLSKKKSLFFLLALGILIRFLFWNHPAEAVFDEYGYLNNISAYYTGEFVFDVHPPLAKLLWAGFGKFTGFRPGASGTQIKYEEMGSSFPGKEYLPLRFLSMLVGVLLPLAVFLMSQELGFSLRASLVAGILLVLDNGLVTQSRFILAEPFLLLFGISCLYFYLKYCNRNKLIDLIWAGVFGSFAFSVKWTGGSFMALIFLAEIIRLLRYGGWKEWKSVLRTFVVLVVMPVFIYFFIFATHLSFLVKSGPGNAYMSSGFRNKNIWSKVVENNVVMFTANQQDLTHPYSSKWYTWPFGLKPIYYWVKGEEKIYLFGNPAIWWSATASMIVLIFYYGLPEIIKDKSVRFLLGGFLLNFLPFMAIKRAMFLYHYFPALIFTVLILAYLLDREKNAKFAFVILTLLAALSFFHFAPVTYGLAHWGAVF